MSIQTPEAPNLLAPPELYTDGGREALLRQLLPYDYDYAQQSGLFDLFDYDPDTGEDGLMHTLAGNIVAGADGAFIPQGYHHEESGNMVWGMIQTADGGSRPITRVDRDHLQGANSKTLRRYAERPGEPYVAQVAVGDRPKYMVRTNAATGEVNLERAKSTMYPQEYDALAVMQAVRIAYESRDRQLDRPSQNDRGEDVLVNESSVPLIDGKSKMTVRLVINPHNMRVKTAIPILGNDYGIMNLTAGQLLGHATYHALGE